MTPPRVNYLEVAQTFVAYVAIPTALVYPFGFVALFLQFTRYFGFEVYTAWYATSLVNRMVVIGQGATILVVTLIGSVLLSVMVSQVLFWRETRAGSNRVGRWIMIAALMLLSVMVPLLYVLYSRVLAAGRVSWEAIVGTQSEECITQAMRHQLNFWPDSLVPAFIFISGGLWGGWLIYDSYKKYRDRPFADQRQNPVGDYRLRSVFKFLSHADGRWHFIHRITNRAGEREYRIISLRETAEQAEYIRVRPHPERRPRVAPFPWENPSTGDLKLCKLNRVWPLPAHR